MKTWPMPTEPGFWWAKWKIADEGTRDFSELDLSVNGWEPVEVVENCLDPTNDEYLKVSVGGVEMSQCPENFFWGPKIELPKELA